jgi:hypothetical protein
MMAGTGDRGGFLGADVDSSWAMRVVEALAGGAHQWGAGRGHGVCRQLWYGEQRQQSRHGSGSE